ncbi:MAG TPA: AMP-binding protein [Candidatus Acidoferrales bacterium]|nr:AMP-binding protein [Candidatus Acidoferrales bacterium]
MTVAPPRLSTLLDHIDSAVATYGDRACLVLPDAALTYGELDRLANAAAAVLLDRGVREGSVVMTLCHNGAAIVATWFACLKLGAVFAPLNASLSGDPLAHVLARAGGSVLVCDNDLVEAARAASHDVESLRHTLAGRDTFERALHAAGTAAPPRPRDNPAAPARLMFTSGTTGESKGVLWSRYAETLHAVCYGDELVRIAPGETSYTCLPLFHVTAQGTLLGTMLRGGRTVIDRRFEPLRFWARTRAAGAVFFPYVGTIISALMARAPRRNDADNPVRRAMGSATPSGLWESFEERFDVRLEDVWGQTETASCWTRARPHGPVVGTVGVPCERFEARIDRGSGAAADAREIGELWIRPSAPHVIFEGYAGAGTEPEDPTEDGWYRTGDLLSRDSDGLLTFHGRLREAIRRRGETIAPEEIEAVAIQHPGIREAAAIGVPADDGVEDEILLCVVMRATAETTPAALHAFLVRRLPRFMVPRFIRIERALPKTATTRVRRLALRDAGRAGAWDAKSRRSHHA